MRNFTEELAPFFILPPTFRKTACSSNPRGEPEQKEVNPSDNFKQWRNVLQPEQNNGLCLKKRVIFLIKNIHFTGKNFKKCTDKTTKTEMVKLNTSAGLITCVIWFHWWLKKKSFLKLLLVRKPTLLQLYSVVQTSKDERELFYRTLKQKCNRNRQKSNIPQRNA